MMVSFFRRLVVPSVLVLALLWSLAPVEVFGQETLDPKDYDTYLLLLSHDERKAYESLASDEERAAWWHRFWKERDPTPTTDLNERLQEHLRRVAYARTFYRAPNRLGFDDRGRIYVKYGEPDDRYVEPAGNVTRGNESWVYHGFSGGLAFDFVDKNGMYVMAPLNEALVAEGESRSWLDAVRRMYRERANLHPKYNRILSELDRLSTVVGVRDVRFDVQQLIDRVEVDVRTDQMRAPPDQYVHDYGGDPLPLVFHSANFKGREGKTRVEVYFAAAFGSLGFVPSESGLTTTLLPVAAIYDHNYNLVARDSMRVTLNLSASEKRRQKNFVNQFVFELDPGQYLLFLRAENPESQRIGIFRMPIVVQNFDTDRLTLSDIQFSHRIRAADSGDKFVKNGLVVAPYPFRSVYQNQQFAIYYEIYNLQQGPDGKTSYVIDYSVTVVKTRRGGIAAPVQSITGVFSDGTKERITSTVTRQGTSREAIEYIGFNLSELPPGTLELTVQVKDQLSGNEVSASRRFDLLP